MDELVRAVALNALLAEVSRGKSWEQAAAHMQAQFGAAPANPLTEDQRAAWARVGSDDRLFAQLHCASRP
jgi:hypothetical protein